MIPLLSLVAGWEEKFMSGRVEMQLAGLRIED